MVEDVALGSAAWFAGGIGHAIRFYGIGLVPGELIGSLKIIYGGIQFSQSDVSMTSMTEQTIALRECLQAVRVDVDSFSINAPDRRCVYPAR